MCEPQLQNHILEQKKTFGDTYTKLALAWVQLHGSQLVRRLHHAYRYRRIRMSRSSLGLVMVAVGLGSLGMFRIYHSFHSFHLTNPLVTLHRKVIPKCSQSVRFSAGASTAASAAASRL